MSLEQPSFGTPTHRATLKGIAVDFEQSQSDAAMAWLVAAAGGYDSSLSVVELGKETAVLETKLSDVARKMRLEMDEAAAKANGFAVKDPIYALGRLVNETGVENARRSRQEFEARPYATDLLDQFGMRIRGERRKDTAVRVADLSMMTNGRLVVRNDFQHQLDIADGAFESLVSRTGIGGSGYLKSCWPELRSINVNSWMTRIQTTEADALANWHANGRKGAEPKPSSLVLRVRAHGQGRAVYAVVSSQYRALDCDAIAAAIRESVPGGARGSVVYDGQQTRFEILFHSDVAAEDYGAGEIFRAGVIVRTNDVGDGSIRVSAVVERNLCLNLIVLDTAEQSVAGIRHIGTELPQRFAAAFADAYSKIRGFAESWGAAKADAVAVGAAASSGENLTGLSAREVLAGIIWAQAKRDLVPVRGKRPDVVRDVLKAYDVEPVKTDVLTRVDVVNAWTRYAHETAAVSDPWIEDDIQTAAGALLQSRRPMPYEKPGFAF